MDSMLLYSQRRRYHYKSCVFFEDPLLYVISGPCINWGYCCSNLTN